MFKIKQQIDTAPPQDKFTYNYVLTIHVIKKLLHLNNLKLYIT